VFELVSQVLEFDDTRRDLHHGVHELVQIHPRLLFRHLRVYLVGPARKCGIHFVNEAAHVERGSRLGMAYFRGRLLNDLAEHDIDCFRREFELAAVFLQEAEVFDALHKFVGLQLIFVERVAKAAVVLEHLFQVRSVLHYYLRNLG